jgi:hypothetical protein
VIGLGLDVHDGGDGGEGRMRVVPADHAHACADQSEPPTPPHPAVMPFHTARSEASAHLDGTR